MAGVDAIIVAAGESHRMAGVDKLTASLLGRPLLAWAIEAFDQPRLVERLIVVAPEERLAWLSWEPRLRSRIEVVPGGPRRQESVAAGVRAGNAPTVLVHDGARPLVTSDLGRRVAAAARRYGAAIPVLAVSDTVKRLEGRRIAGTIPRGEIALAQTPQGFRRELLERAWAMRPPGGHETWSDEAALLETIGVAVRGVPGDPDNIKVTESGDLARAEALLAARLGAAAPDHERVRSGFGEDSHPFGGADGLSLGGIFIAEAPRLLGHSDGDVALHAVAGALLGAAALGDLGRVFPAGDPSTKEIVGAALLDGVLARLRRVGYEPRDVDVTIVGARPWLGSSRLEAMRLALAGMLRLAVEQVSVKASSGNLSGDEGAGRVISARAVATVRDMARR